MTQAPSNSKLKESLKWPLAFIGLIWFIHSIQFIFGFDLAFWGIYPLEWFGLKGVITAPLIHGDFAHLINNSIPFLALSTMIIFFYPSVAFRSILMIYILTGLAVWVGGRSVFHIGASGVVYGLVTFLLGNGFFRRNLKSIVLALIVLFFYSGMFVGILPNQEGISWESHLYGALVGLFTSFYFKEEIEIDEETQPLFEEESEDSNHPYFLDRNVFQMTKEERKKASESDQPDEWTSSNTWD